MSRSFFDVADNAASVQQFNPFVKVTGPCIARTGEEKT